MGLAMSEQRFAQRRRAGLWNRIRLWVVALLVLVAIGAAVWMVWFSSVLAVEHVKVEGVKSLKPAAIAEKAEVPVGRPMVSVDLSRIEARVAGLERVESVDVSRSWPHTVTVDVTERTAVAWVNFDGQMQALDRFGVVFSNYSKAPKNLYEVRLSLTERKTRQRALEQVGQIVAFLHSHAKQIDGLIKHVNVSSQDSVELVLTGGRTVMWGNASDDVEKLRVLKPLLQIKVREYDVSAPEQPTTRK